MAKENKTKMNPLLAAVKPIARQYVSAENIGKVFDRVTGDCDILPGEKAVIMLSRGEEGDVRGAVYGVNGRIIESQYTDRVAVDELIMQLLS